MSPAEAEAAVASLALARNRQIADLIALAFGIAKETHPEVLQSALVDLLDLKALEERNRRVAAEVQATTERALELRHLLENVLADLGRIEERQGSLEFRTEKGMDAVTRLAEAFKRLAQPKTEAAKR